MIKAEIASKVYILDLCPLTASRSSPVGVSLKLVYRHAQHFIISKIKCDGIFFVNMPQKILHVNAGFFDSLTANQIICSVFLFTLLTKSL